MRRKPVRSGVGCGTILLVVLAVAGAGVVTFAKPLVALLGSRATTAPAEASAPLPPAEATARLALPPAPPAEGLESPEDPPSTTACAGPVTLSAAAEGALFVDGHHTGRTAPASIELAPGHHTLGVGTAGGYLWRSVSSVEGHSPCAVTLTPADRMRPRQWRALVVVTPSVSVRGSDCVVRASPEDEAAMRRHVEGNFGLLHRYAYGTMAWKIDWLRIAAEVHLSDGETALNIGKADPPEDGPSAYIDAVKSKVTPGTYDLVAFVRRATGKDAAGKSCDTRKGFWIGLGWFDATFMTGTLDVRYDNTVDGRSDDFVQAVHTMIADGNAALAHEWLHTVERYYPRLPSCCTEWPLHDTDHYRFAGSDGDWQQLFFRGTIADVDHPGEWLGITVEAAHRCTTRDRVRAPDRCATQ